MTTFGLRTSRTLHNRGVKRKLFVLNQRVDFAR